MGISLSPPSAPCPAVSAPTCMTLKRVQGHPAVLLSATLCTVTMPVTTGCISTGQKSCGWNQSRPLSQLPRSLCPCRGQTMPHTSPSHSWSHTSYPFTPLTFSLASGRPRETSTWAPCSHTSSQSSFGPAEPVRTTWSRPHGPPCRSQFVGSQELRCLLAIPLLPLAAEDPRTQTFSPTPHPRRHPESTNDQRASDRVTRSASSHGEEPGF